MSHTYMSGLGAAAIGVVIHIIGLATSGWSSYDAKDSAGTKYNRGLWQTCGCVDLLDSQHTKEVDAVRAMVIIGALLGVVAVLLLLINAICNAVGNKSMSRHIYTIAAILCFLAFIFILIGVIVYATNFHNKLNSRYDLSYSFALTIVGGFVILVAGVLILLAGRGMA